MRTNREMIATMKVNAGVRSTIAEAKVGELYAIPVYINVCSEQLAQRHHIHNQISRI